MSDIEEQEREDTNEGPRRSNRLARISNVLSNTANTLLGRVSQGADSQDHVQLTVVVEEDRKQKKSTTTLNTHTQFRTYTRTVVLSCRTS